MLNVLVKPSSGKCQMRCAYCFYRDEAEIRSQADFGLMNINTAKELIDKAFSFSEDGVVFTFQGGEPTVVGINFFREFTGYANSIALKSAKTVGYSLQTNGYCINDEWADFFRENSFLIGLSLDGNETIHNKLRKDKSGHGTYKKVIATAALLKEFGVDFNVLTVVTSDVVNDIEEIYGEYARRGFIYQQYIPCLEPINGKDSNHFAISDAEYGKFLTKLFACYKADMMNGKYVYIRRFENWREMLSGYEPEECCLSGRCVPQIVVEADGSVYPCDFYCIEQYCLGNICDNTIKELFYSEQAFEFAKNQARTNEKCRVCKWGAFCRGGCPREKTAGKSDFRYCNAIYDFLESYANDFSKINQKW